MARQYSTGNTLTCTSINSLGNSATAIACSAAYTPSTTANVTEVHVECTISSPATFTASGSTVVNVYAAASVDGTIWDSANVTMELIDGTDKAVTLDADGNNLRFLGSVLMPQTTAGTSVIHKKTFPIAASMGFLPKKFVVLFQNQTGATLPASGHSFSVTEEYFN